MMSHRQGWVGACVALAAGSGCHHERPHRAEPPRFEVTTAARQDVALTREYVCQIRAIQHIEVRGLERGYLRDIFVDEGQSVRRGQALFQITPVMYQAELARGAAEVHYAQVEYQNTQLLREGNVVSPAALALARANLDRANAQRDLAQAHLRFTHIDAPFDGIVGRLMARRGSLIGEGDLLTVLADNHEMWVYFNVSEREYISYRQTHRPGERVEVRLRMANDELFSHPGVVQTIEADFNNETGTIAFRAGFPNPEGLLRHGETGTILMSSVRRGALVIPQLATYRVLDKVFVFAVARDNTVHAREVTVGDELPHRYVVERGLDEGDRVLVEGLRRVRDGDRVVPNMVSLERVLSEVSHIPAE